MELRKVLDEYEKLVKSILYAPTETVREVREKRAWNIYRFLIRCGVSESELTKIEDKYNY